MGDETRREIGRYGLGGSDCARASEAWNARDGCTVQRERESCSRRLARQHAAQEEPSSCGPSLGEGTVIISGCGQMLTWPSSRIARYLLPSWRSLLVQAGSRIITVQYMWTEHTHTHVHTHTQGAISAIQAHDHQRHRHHSLYLCTYLGVLPPR
jgi:hypothetical protein